jgi:multiple sugar transport system ATP-binding protein
MPQVRFNDIGKIYPDGTPAVADLNLEIPDREFLCLLGPSGCGKSSTLRMLAGLETITSGDLMVDGRRINAVPPQARDMAMVFENYALYPHLTAFDNIAMPLVARHVERAEIAERVAAVAETLDITPHLRKFPNQLSGGQRQRVALGRAIVRTPKMFLMDEPLGHLEAYMRGQLRAEMRRLHERLGTTTVYITHDQEEAAAIADRIAVMNKGRLQQVGQLIDLLDRPVNQFVAEFVGHLPINIIAAEVEGSDSGFKLRIGPLSMPLTQELAVGIARSQRRASLTLGVRPHDVSLAEQSDVTAVPGRVTSVEPQGDIAIVVGDTEVGRLRAVLDSDRAPTVGESICYRLDMARAHLFDSGGANLRYTSEHPTTGG